MFDGYKFKTDSYRNIHFQQEEIKEMLWNNNATKKDIGGLVQKLETHVLHKHDATAIWLYLDLDYCDTVKTLVQDHQYKIHHAKMEGQSEAKIVLTKWLEKSRPDALPHYSSHTLGVGGVVIHPDQTKVLLIQERFRPQGANNWKFPGGLVDLGETLPQAAAREVLEETGIESEFVGVFGCREILNFRHGMGDLYFPCLMKCTGTTQIAMQSSEISQCEWLPFSEMRKLKFYSIANQVVWRYILPNVSDDGKWVGFTHYNSNSDSVLDNLRFKTLGRTQTQVAGREQAFYTLWEGSEPDPSLYSTDGNYEKIMREQGNRESLQPL